MTLTLPIDRDVDDRCLRAAGLSPVDVPGVGVRYIRTPDFEINDNPELLTVLLRHCKDMPITQAVRDSGGGNDVFSMLSKLVEELQEFIEDAILSPYSQINLASLRGAINHHARTTEPRYQLLHLFLTHTNLGMDEDFIDGLRAHFVKAATGFDAPRRYACISASALALDHNRDYILRVSWDDEFPAQYRTNRRAFLRALEKAVVDLDVLMVSQELYVLWSSQELKGLLDRTVLQLHENMGPAPTIAATIAKYMCDRAVVVISETSLWDDAWMMKASEALLYYQRTNTEE